MGIFITVFHRILDFKAGLDFYPGPFFLPGSESFNTFKSFKNRLRRLKLRILSRRLELKNPKRLKRFLNDF